TTFEVTEDANSRYLDRMSDLIEDSVFTVGSCATSRSYYFDPAGEASLLRPMPTRTALKEASTFPLSDYQIA
ncbi:NAD(P)/FAD-dependent oxidoreductase, partial [Mycolicibacterium elephantis]